MADKSAGQSILSFLQSPLGGGLAAGGVSLLGNYLAGQNYDEAAAAQAAAQERALALQAQIYGETKAAAQPYLESGSEGIRDYVTKISNFTQPQYTYKQEDFDRSKFKSEGYDWILDQARRTNDAAAAKKGMVLGSGAAKSLQERAAGLASQEMQNSYDRWLKDSMLRQNQAENAYNRDYTFKNQDILNSLNQSKFGQEALNTLGAFGANYGKTASETLGNIGDAQATGQVAQGQNWINTTNLMSGALSKYFQDEASKTKSNTGGK